MTVSDGFDQRLLVDGHVQGLAHLRLGQQAVLVVDQQVIFTGGRVGVDHHVLVFLQLFHAGERYKDRRVEFVVLHHAHARVVIGHRHPFHAVQAHAAGLPEIRVFLQDHAVALAPLVHGKRAGRHRVFRVGVFAHLGHGFFRQDRHRRRRQLREEGHSRGFQGDHQGLGIAGRGGVDQAERVAPQRGLVVADAQQAERGVGGSDRRAVRELRLAQLEGVGQAILGNVPAFGEARFHLGAQVIHAHQGVVDVGKYPGVAVLRAFDRVESGAVFTAADGEHTGGMGQAGGQRPGREGSGGEQFQVARVHITTPC